MKFHTALSLMVVTAVAPVLCQASVIFEFSGNAVALDGSSIAESFTYNSPGGVPGDTTIPGSSLAVCTITGDTCDYVSILNDGPGDTVGHHPEIEIGGNLGAFDYYFPYNSFTASGTEDALNISGNTGVLRVTTPEPSSIVPLSMLAVAGLAIFGIRKGVRL